MRLVIRLLLVLAMVAPPVAAEEAPFADAGADAKDVGPSRYALVTPLAQYAEDMGVSRRIVDDMLAIPASRVLFVTAAQLARYGLSVSIAP